LRVATEKSSGSPDDLSLLVVIDRADSGGVVVLIAETDFSKNKAVSVLHDEIHLAHSTAKIPGDLLQALRFEVIKC